MGGQDFNGSPSEEAVQRAQVLNNFWISLIHYFSLDKSESVHLKSNINAANCKWTKSWPCKIIFNFLLVLVKWFSVSEGHQIYGLEVCSCPHSARAGCSCWCRSQLLPLQCGCSKRDPLVGMSGVGENGDNGSPWLEFFFFLCFLHCIEPVTFWWKSALNSESLKFKRWTSQDRQADCTRLYTFWILYVFSSESTFETIKCMSCEKC